MVSSSTMSRAFVRRSGPTPSSSSVDFLVRFDGAWKIVNKIYTSEKTSGSGAVGSGGSSALQLEVIGAAAASEFEYSGNWLCPGYQVRAGRRIQNLAGREALEPAPVNGAVFVGNEKCCRADPVSCPAESPGRGRQRGRWHGPPDVGPVPWSNWLRPVSRPGGEPAYPPGPTPGAGCCHPVGG